MVLYKISVQIATACHCSLQILRNFAAVHLNKLIKKGGGTGPMKPWQPHFYVKVPNPIPFLGKDKLKRAVSTFRQANYDQ